MFNPYAPSNRHSSLAATYRQHGTLKKRLYEQRVCEVEHASFIPLVFSLTGNLGPAATTFYKRLASMLSDKWKQPYSTTIGWLRCRLSFCLQDHQSCASEVQDHLLIHSVGSCRGPGSHRLVSEAINRHCWNYLLIELVLYHYFSSISPSFTYTWHCVGIGFGLLT